MMLKKQMARLVLLGISVAIILILPTAYVGGSVLGYTDNYTDNLSAGPPPDEVTNGGVGGCLGVDGCLEDGCGSCWSKQTAMSYTVRASPASPPPPSPLPPLAVNVRTLPINTRDLTMVDFGSLGGGGSTGPIGPIGPIGPVGR